MRAGWFFCFTVYNPEMMELLPEWPAGFDRSTVALTVYDVRRLDSDAAPADHVHQVMGTLAFQNDGLGDGHYHYVQHFGGAWHQVTEGPSHHEHPFLAGGVDDVRFLPDFFIGFLSCEDAAFAELDASNRWFLIGEAEVTEGEEGGWVFGDIDNTLFTTQEKNAWTARFAQALGRRMPDVITNPRRLVSWFCPMAAPNMYDWWWEGSFRPTSRE